MPIDWNALVLEPCHATFGEPAVYTPQGGAPFPINGVFDKAYEGIVVLQGEAVSERMPVLGCKAVDFTTYPKQDDTLVVRGESYVVREVRDDSHGAIKLMLNGPM